MLKRSIPPRERAARALMEGWPLWENYLREVDAVLGAVLGPDEVERMVDEEERR